MDDVYFDEPLVFDPLLNDNGLFLMRTEFVAMDAFLVTVILALYFTQLGLGDDLNYLHIGMLMMVRAILKLPFAVAIIRFILKVKEIRH